MNKIERTIVLPLSDYRGSTLRGSVTLCLQRHEGQRKTVNLTPTAQPYYFELTAQATIKGSTYGESGGQCLDAIRELWGPVLPPDVARVIELWERWHMNGLKAGTAKQEEALKDCPHKNYTDACVFLRGLGLYEDRGYRYGSSWLVEELPPEVIDEVQAFIGGAA